MRFTPASRPLQYSIDLYCSGYFLICSAARPSPSVSGASRMASRRFHRSRRRRCSPCQGNLSLEVARFKARHVAKPQSNRPLLQDGTEADHHLCSGIRAVMKTICRRRQSGAPHELRAGGCSSRIESFNACALSPIYYMRTAPVDRPQISKRRWLDDIPARPPRKRRKRCR